MKRNIIFFLIVLYSAGLNNLAANKLPDFIISEIVVQTDQFIHIKLQNKSTVDCPISPGLKEKIFLVIYINNIKRAEYKIKYIDLKLFKPNGTTRFRTNFRMQKGLNLKVEINHLKVISESDFSNNVSMKQFT